MIFDAHSNAAYRVSLRGPGAELEGARVIPEFSNTEAVMNTMIWF